MDGIAVKPRRGLQAVAPLFVNLFERVMPDPFVLAVGLTALVALLAWPLAPKGMPAVILSSWHAGTFNILGFAFQMILILATGHALANAPPVARGLRRVVALAHTLTSPSCSRCGGGRIMAELWRFGLVVGAMLAREVARRVRVDFGWLVVAAYSGWVIRASGPSSSIGLSQATHGNALNIVEKLTG
jgi:short-chain fatty acids transporter